MRRDERGPPHELRYGTRRGCVIEHFRRADLDHAPSIHERHAIRDRERVFLIVGNEERGDPLATQNRAQLVAHRLA